MKKNCNHGFLYPFKKKEDEIIMNYLIEDEQLSKNFKNHVATLKILNDDTQTLEWSQPDTRVYQIDYVFHKNLLFISGDLGDTVFNCTWKPKWNFDNGWMIELDYLASKISAMKDSKYIWSSITAIEDLKAHYRELFDELDDNEFKILSVDIFHTQNSSCKMIEDEDDLEITLIPYKNRLDKNLLLHYCIAIRYAIGSSSTVDFYNNLEADPNFVDTYDFYEWGYKCGMRLNPTIRIYLAGLQMAYKQLLERNTVK